MHNDTCFIKVTAKSPVNGYFGLLALAYTQNIPLEPNRLHVGILERERVYHYVIGKEDIIVTLC